MGYVCSVLATTLAALAEPNRLGIVELLRKGPQPVTVICARVALGQPQVSKHLRVLRDAGLVHVQPRGRQRLYALRTAPLRELDAWLERFRANWGEHFDQMDELLRRLGPTAQRKRRRAALGSTPVSNGNDTRKLHKRTSRAISKVRAPTTSATRTRAKARNPATIDEYLDQVRGDRRVLLQRLRETIRKIIPDAEECISYAMPAFRLQGKVVAGFAATTKGCSYFPFSGSTLGTLANELRGYDKTKSALHFTTDKPLPTPLVRKLIQARVAEIKG